jgi:dipeptidyl aminopeptidase/acylaminoacyl peptidase
MRANLYWLPVPHSGSVSIRQAHPVTSGNQLVVGDDVSRDGQWVTFDSNIEGRSNIYVMPVGGGEARRLTRSQGESWSPSFSPDGREIVFYSTRFGTRDVFLIRTDGTGEVRLTSDSGEQYNPRFSPDGLQVVYTLERGGERAVFVIRRDSIGGAWSAPTRLASDGGSARWSPDGRQLVYRSRRGISVLTQDGRSRGEVVLEREGRFLGDPSWSPDGRAIWYGATGARNGEAGLFEVPVMGGRSRMIVRLDDSTRAVGSFGKTVSGGKLYLIIWEFESNIYVADLKHR